MKKINDFENIIFDLDGTLLDSHRYQFRLKTAYYLYFRFYKLFGRVRTVLIILKSINKMLNNDSAQELSNYEVLVNSCSRLSGVSKEVILRQLDLFYNDDFNSLQKYCKPILGSTLFVNLCLKENKKLYVWTNPIWPERNVVERIRWAGLDPKIFSGITHSANSKSCKPSLDYFVYFKNYFKINSERSLYIGDNIKKDGPVADIGVSLEILGLNREEAWKNLIKKYFDVEVNGSLLQK